MIESKLSPAAYAVLSAVTQRKYSLDPEDIPQLAASIRSGVAIALRAAADQVVPKEIEPANAFEEEGFVPFRLREQRQETRRKLLAIAAELEA